MVDRMHSRRADYKSVFIIAIFGTINYLQLTDCSNLLSHASIMTLDD